MTTIVSMGFSRDQALKALRATVGAIPSSGLGPLVEEGESEGPSFGSKARDIGVVGRGWAPRCCGCDEGAEAFTGAFLAPRTCRRCNAFLLPKNNSLERAVDWIFSHIDDLDAEAAMDISEGRSAADSISESVPVGPKVRDGSGSECPGERGQAWYNLASLLYQSLIQGSFASHMGQGQKLLPCDRTPKGGILGGGDPSLSC